MQNSVIQERGQPCASLRGIDVAFGAQRVLQKMDWTVEPGRIVGLLGRNGVGKTTLIETVLGLRTPAAGQACLFGQPAGAADDVVRARIGYVPQRSDLFEWMTAEQLLAYFRSFYPHWNAVKTEALFSRWDIPRGKPVAQLSVGQQQRLSIIRALAHEPELLVLDEPVASLDPVGRRDFLRELVEQVIDRNTTVVFSTHILSDLERVAMDVAFLAGGRIVVQSPLDELLESCMRLNGNPAAVSRYMQANRLVALGATESSSRIVRAPAGAGRPAQTDEVRVQPLTLEDLFVVLA